MRTDNLPGRADSTCCKHHSLLFFLIGVELLSNVVWVPPVQQSESLYVHISFQSPQSTEFSALYSGFSCVTLSVWETGISTALLDQGPSSMASPPPPAP